MREPITPSARGVAVLFAAVFALLLAMAGCGKIPKVYYYSLEASLPPLPAGSSAPLPVDIAVARFRAGRPLMQDRLVFRPAPNQVDFYEYHRWVEPPPDMVARNMIAALRRANLFRSVSSAQEAPRADYLLRGTIESLEEVDSGESVSARVVLAAELVDTKTRASLWTGRGSQEASIGERSVEGLVGGLNQGLNQSIEQLVRGLTTHLQQHPPK